MADHDQKWTICASCVRERVLLLPEEDWAECSLCSSQDIVRWAGIWFALFAVASVVMWFIPAMNNLLGIGATVCVTLAGFVFLNSQRISAGVLGKIPLWCLERALSNLQSIKNRQTKIGIILTLVGVGFGLAAYLSR